MAKSGNKTMVDQSPYRRQLISGGFREQPDDDSW